MVARLRFDVDGLAALRRDLKAAGDLEGLAEMRDGLKAAARVVADDAKGRVPRKSGRAADSIRAGASGARAYVAGGKASVPYYGWLDFGSRRPQHGQPRRVGPWAKSGTGPPGGRFIYAAVDARQRDVVDLIERAAGRALERLDL